VIAEIVMPVRPASASSRLLATALAAAACLSASAQAQGVGLSRTDLQRHDLSVPGRETVQVRVDFAPGAVAFKHKHPGEEIVYVLKGALEYDIQGRPPVKLEPGDVVFIPYGTPHSVKNIGKGEASELATYVVEKGKPLVTQVK
jgi:quercetin dioxygenase-like cupin family protein